MEILKKNFYLLFLISIFFILFIIIFILGIRNNLDTNSKNEIVGKLFSNPENTIKIIASFENKYFGEILEQYSLLKNFDINVEYAGTLEIIKKINDGEKYNAIWISDTMWLGMLDEEIKYSSVNYTHVNPIVVVLKNNIVKENKLIEKENILMKDIGILF